jgi:hypothetical protein
MAEARRYPTWLLIYVLTVLVELYPFLLVWYVLSGGAHGGSLFGINQKCSEVMFWVVLVSFPLRIMKICKGGTTKKTENDTRSSP